MPIPGAPEGEGEGPGISAVPQAGGEEQAFRAALIDAGEVAPFLRGAPDPDQQRAVLPLDQHQPFGKCRRIDAGAEGFQRFLHGGFVRQGPPGAQFRQTPP
jgi:hypothetical protein